MKRPGIVQLGAEALGTFILVFGGCGAAVIAASAPPGSAGVLGALMAASRPGVGMLGVALAFGLALLAGVYAIGPISGAHFNPAVSVGLACAGRFPWRRVPGYVLAQLFGAIVAAGLLLVIAKGQPNGYIPELQGLAANGYGAHSPGGYSLVSGLLGEVLLTFIFLTVVLGATSKFATTAQAGLAIGLALTLVHLIGIPLTNTSVNPARSTGPALFVGGWALRQLWLFWLAPIVGAALAGAVARWFEAVGRQAMRSRGGPEHGTDIPGHPLPTA
jgi:aquaporin Z